MAIERPQVVIGALGEGHHHVQPVCRAALEDRNQDLIFPPAAVGRRRSRQKGRQQTQAGNGDPTILKEEASSEHGPSSPLKFRRPEKQSSYSDRLAFLAERRLGPLTEVRQAHRLGPDAHAGEPVGSQGGGKVDSVEHQAGIDPGLGHVGVAGGWLAQIQRFPHARHGLQQWGREADLGAGGAQRAGHQLQRLFDFGPIRLGGKELLGAEDSAQGLADVAPGSAGTWRRSVVPAPPEARRQRSRRTSLVAMNRAVEG